jgi:hypothetical protein
MSNSRGSHMKASLNPRTSQSAMKHAHWQAIESFFRQSHDRGVVEAATVACWVQFVEISCQ